MRIQLRPIAITLAAVIVALGLPSFSQAAVLLGGKAFGPEGFGTPHPARISNGGDLSGLVTHIHWQSWGGTTATAWGKNSIFKPRGGYYKRPVSIKLRASNLGYCAGRRAYTHLAVRFPSHPGGRLGPWRAWSGASSICSWPSYRPGAPSLTRLAQSSCPNVAALVRPANPRGAIQAAKAASYGHSGRVLGVKRGPRSVYAPSARRLCGQAVLQKSVYVEVHPAGMVCAACNFHGFLVKYRRGPWKVWTTF
jgi:hypothetical protein